jgi:hypothetical protein
VFCLLPLIYELKIPTSLLYTWKIREKVFLMPYNYKQRQSGFYSHIQYTYTTIRSWCIYKKQTCFQDHLATLNMHLQWMELRIMTVSISGILHKVHGTLKMEVACSSKMLVFIHHTTQFHIPQSCNLHSLHRKTLTLHMTWGEFHVFTTVQLMDARDFSSMHKATRV